MTVTELLLQILVNTTREEEGRNSFLLVKQPTRRGLYLLRLIYLLKNVDFENKYCVKSYAYLPYILCNLTQSFDGRQLLVEPQRNLLKYLIPFINNYDIIENRIMKSKNKNKNNDEFVDCYEIFMNGIWDTLKNICMGLDDSPDVLLSVLKPSSNNKTDKLCKDESKQQQSGILTFGGTGQSDDKKNKNNDNDNEDEEEDNNDDETNAEDKLLIVKYFMNVFCNIDNVNENNKFENRDAANISDNNFIFELISPIIGAIHEYDSKTFKLRKKIEYLNKMRNTSRDKNKNLNDINDINENKNDSDNEKEIDMKSKYKLNRFDKILRSYMKYDKMRCDNVRIRKICLECLHLIVGVTDRYGLETQLPVFLNKYVYLKALLENYQNWEYDPVLIDLTKQILKTLNWQLKVFNFIQKQMYSLLYVFII